MKREEVREHLWDGLGAAMEKEVPKHLFRVIHAAA